MTGLFVTSIELAAMCGKSKRCIQHALLKNQIPSQLIDGKYLISREDAEMYVEAIHLLKELRQKASIQ